MLRNTPSFAATCSKFPHMIHGGDYNPEQWLHDPRILEEDVRLMKLSGCNTMSVGIFSWSMYEAREGEFQFEWMDTVLERLHSHGIKVLMATPSGGKPAWLSAAYPEVRMVQENGLRQAQEGRHNHCRTSPVYREKTQLINRKLAERYGQHPAVIGWHVSNEYSGNPCYCNLCFTAFRNWLKEQYQDLAALNLAWWANFWSHRVNTWDEITHIDRSVHAMVLDWKRFITDQTVSFYLSEIEPLRALTPDLPCFVNMMPVYEPLNYWKFAPHVDIITWDSYPRWHSARHQNEAVGTAFHHDLFRSLKQGQPFLLMESTPSSTNWQSICRSKRPGMHLLSAIQAVAHGSDSVQYFQWRKSRGSFEKFHGAVVDHVGHEHTRVFKDVSRVGEVLSAMDDIVGSRIQADVAIIFDWENLWAINESRGPNNEHKHYVDRVIAHYAHFWQRGIAVDVINQEQSFADYKLVIAPMLYMVKDGVGERMTQFVEKGGCLVATYWSGIVNQHDLCHLGGFPGPLRQAMGIWVEETDALWSDQSQTVNFVADNALTLAGSFEATDYADIIHLEGATALALYEKDFYAGSPALTVNTFGKGQAYYIGARLNDAGLEAFYTGLIDELALTTCYADKLPQGVSASLRKSDKGAFLFLLNFNDDPVTLNLPSGHDLISNKPLSGESELCAFGVVVLRLS